MTQTVIHFHRTTTLTPEQFVAGLTDFGPGRSKIFGNSSDKYLKVHYRGSFEADVTEGSYGIWERLHYDWSDPDRVLVTTTDSNVWGAPSWYSYISARLPNGKTDIDVVVVRDSKNLKGRVLAYLLLTIGRGVLERAFEKSIKAIEARNCAASRWRGSIGGAQGFPMRCSSAGSSSVWVHSCAVAQPESTD